MTTKYNEYPDLTHKAKCVLMNTFKGIDVSKPYWDRRFAAAVIREAMKQTGLLKIDEEGPKFVDARKLEAIANNLHALPPEPPLKNQALDIWGEVEGGVSDSKARIMRAALALIPDPTP
jgi:hypothetical protein